MKLILFTTVILLAAIVKANLRPPGALAKAIAKCTEETGAASDIIEKIRNHDLSFDDAKGKCFLKCLCTKLGVCDGDNKLVGKTFSKHSKLLAEKVRRLYSRYILYKLYRLMIFGFILGWRFPVKL